jgi:replicative DNA helicase
MNYTERLLKLKDYSGEDEIVTSYDIAYEIEQNANIIKIKSGFPTLDKTDCLDGFEGGELIVISGPRKAGKSLFSQSLTVNFFNRDVKSLWFSFEMPARQFLQRFPNPLPAILMPRKLKAYALEWLNDRILEAIAKHGISVVFVDHLHFLFDMARSRNVSLEIGTIIRHLKTMAIDLNIVIFLMCHTNKISPIQEDMTDDSMRDSSFVSQESDVALMIWRVKNTDDKATLKICYSRRTGTWEKTVKIQKIGGLLREVYD